MASGKPHKPSEGSYTEMRARAQSEAAKPLGLFWSVLGGIFLLGFFLVFQVLMIVPQLWRLIPKKQRSE